MSVESANIHLSRTGFQDETGPWYVLDNAGIIMPAVSNAVATSLFRISADLDAPVNLGALQEALDRCVRRFPYFVVELKRGFFWYYLEPHAKRLRVGADAISPSQNYDINKKGRCLFRVRARGSRVACEFSHALTDGTGGLRFFKNLLVEYCAAAAALRGSARFPTGTALADPDIYCMEEPPDHLEYEDAYHRHFTEEYPKPDRLPRAFHLPSAQLPPFDYRITCGVVPLDRIVALAKSFDATVTELLAAVFLDALQEIWLASPPAQRRKRSRLAVEIPVNMRKFYPTRTNRNFSLFVLMTQDMRLGRRDFAEIVSRVHLQMRLEIDVRTIAQQISRNVAGARTLAVRLVPLVVKDFFARLLFSALGEDLVSGFVSNLGPVSLPEGAAEHVERIDFLPAPSVHNKTSASVVSWKGRLYVNFGSLAQSRELERLFFTRLVALGLPVKVECNL